MSDWFESWFGEDYVALYPHRDAAEAEHAVELIERYVESSPRTRVLDLACGGGRHARVLSTRWKTTGLDLSSVLLRLARREAPDAEFVRGDMRVLPFRKSAFGLVVNLFTSFGYFETDEEHHAVLREVGRVTSTDGIFVLDFLNAPLLSRTLVPYDEVESDGRIVEQRRSITDDGRFVIKRICIRGESREFVERVRLFGPDDLHEMFDEGGFAISAEFGDYDGSSFTEDSPRMIVVGRRR